MSLDGKIALITGAIKGIGRAFSEILLKNGAKVSLLDINTSEGNELKTVFDSAYGEGRTCFIRCDVSSETELNDAFQKTIETFGRLDIICNNAGILDEQDWEKMVSVNLNGVIRGTLLGLKHMKKEEGGVIVNVSSLAGLGPLPSAPVYTATKHGVVGFSRALAVSIQAGAPIIFEGLFCLTMYFLLKKYYTCVCVYVCCILQTQIINQFVRDEHWFTIINRTAKERYLTPEFIECSPKVFVPCLILYTMELFRLPLMSQS
uniref:15-hydroxyprostaglandin dehydrogenase [NAD(+)]-like n=1 Tax=Erpetoichthys calabaricus TaxID=27687 RepID=A0A8C4SAE3_ERPCA